MFDSPGQATVFRPYTAEHYSSVLPHVLALHAEDPSSTPGNAMSPERFRRTSDELLARPEKGCIVVFDQGGLVVGYAILILFWSNEYGGDIVNVDELFVTPECRGRGVGEAFFGWLRERWRDRAVAIALETSPQNQRAAGFYQRLGFSPYPNVQRWAPLGKAGSNLNAGNP